MSVLSHYLLATSLLVTFLIVFISSACNFNPINSVSDNYVALAVAPDGTVFVSAGGDTVFKIDLNGVRTSFIFNSGSSFTALFVDFASNLWVGDNANSGTFSRYNLDGTFGQSYSLLPTCPGVSSFGRFQSNPNILALTCPTETSAFSYNLTDGSYFSFSTSGKSFSGIAFDGTGIPFVASPNLQSIFEFDANLLSTSEQLYYNTTDKAPSSLAFLGSDMIIGSNLGTSPIFGLDSSLNLAPFSVQSFTSPGRVAVNKKSVLVAEASGFVHICCLPFVGVPSSFDASEYVGCLSLTLNATQNGEFNFASSISPNAAVIVNTNGFNVTLNFSGPSITLNSLTIDGAGSATVQSSNQLELTNFVSTSSLIINPGTNINLGGSFAISPPASYAYLSGVTINAAGNIAVNVPDFNIDGSVLMATGSISMSN